MCSVELSLRTELYVLLAAGAVSFIAASRYGQQPFEVLFGRLVEARAEVQTQTLKALRDHERRVFLELSHNLQTPLAILRSRVERFERTVARDGAGPDLGQYVDAVSGRVSELLSLAQLERSLTTDPRRRFSLSALMREIVEECAVIADEQAIRLVGYIAPRVFLTGNERRIRDAVMNLLGNAVKYMGDGPEQEIRISLETTSDHTRIVVADTGIGIPAHELPRIFESFYRGTNRAYDDLPGTGLGLAAVKRIVEEHGGTIEAESEVGVGSTFTLSFPRTARARSRRRHS